MLYTLLTRSLLDVNVLHDRNPVAVKLSDGSIRNAYTVHLLNKRGFDRIIAIDVDGRAPRGRELPVREGLTRIIVDWSGSWQSARPGNWLGRSPATKAALGR